MSAPAVPALLLTPRHDQFCPPASATRIAADWASVEVEVIEGADHFLAGHTGHVAARTIEWLTARS
jgi:pimeloyl-ACP methyl ester carboxylesterase